MALFDRLSKGRNVTCAHCGTTIRENDAKNVNGKYYCTTCHAKLELAALALLHKAVSSKGGSGAEPSTLRDVQRALDQADMRYNTQKVDDQWVVNLNISGKANSYQIRLIIKDDDLSLRIFGLANYPGKRQDAYRVLFRFQEKYRFLRFTLDDDNSIDVGYDLPDCLTNPGKVAVEMVLRTMKIIDDIYPELMRSAWGAGQNAAGQRSSSQSHRGTTQVCPVCGSNWSGKTELCPSCLRKSLRMLRNKAYLTGQLSARDIWCAGKKPDSAFRQVSGCIYCGSRENLVGGLCQSCKQIYLPQMMRKVNEGKNDPQLSRLKKDLYETIRSRHPGLQLDNLALGPTPSGGAYAVRMRSGNSIYIGEFDETFTEINHSRGRTG